MGQDNEPQFASVMIAVAQNYSAQVTSTTIGFMSRALAQYTVHQIEAAAYHIVRTRKYTTMPTIADFVDAIEGTIEDKAMTQALIVWDSIRRVGVYGTPRYGDPVTAQIVAKMGWKSICATMEAQRDWFLRNFVGMYRAHRRVEEVKAIAGSDQVKGLIGGMTKRLGGA